MKRKCKKYNKQTDTPICLGIHVCSQSQLRPPPCPLPLPTPQETSIDEHLVTEWRKVHHTTADAAALLGTMGENGEVEGEEEEEEEDRTERETSIDAALEERLTDEELRQILGPTPDLGGDGSSDEDTKDDEAPRPMNLTETVESSVNDKGKTEVTCSVTVSVSVSGEEAALDSVRGNTHEAGEASAAEVEGGALVHPEAAARGDGLKAEEGKHARENGDLQENGDEVHWKEASFAREENNNPLSVIVVSDGSTTSSSSDDEDQEVKTVPVLKKAEEAAVAAVSNGVMELEQTPGEMEAGGRENCSDEEGYVELPAITLKTPTLKRDSDPNVECPVVNGEETGKLLPAQGKKRKSR